jgi:hypothetical protein
MGEIMRLVSLNHKTPPHPCEQHKIRSAKLQKEKGWDAMSKTPCKNISPKPTPLPSTRSSVFIPNKPQTLV